MQFKASISNAWDAVFFFFFYLLYDHSVVVFVGHDLLKHRLGLFHEILFQF